MTMHTMQRESRQTHWDLPKTLAKPPVRIIGADADDEVTVVRKRPRLPRKPPESSTMQCAEIPTPRERPLHVEEFTPTSGAMIVRAPERLESWQPLSLIDLDVQFVPDPPPATVRMVGRPMPPSSPVARPRTLPPRASIPQPSSTGLMLLVAVLTFAVMLVALPRLAEIASNCSLSLLNRCIVLNDVSPQ